MRKDVVLLALCAFVFIIPAVTAAEPNVNLRSFSDEACPTGSAKYALDITNPGNQADTYSVNTNVDWSTVAPGTVEVGAGETETVFLWLQPPRTMKPGTYGFRATVQSAQTNTETTVQGTIDVLSCRDVTLQPSTQSQQVCRGDTATYNIRVANNGQAEETYELSTDAGALSQEQVTLAPGQSTTVTLSAFSNEAAEEELTVTAESMSSYARDTTTVSFTAEQCRSVDVFVTPDEQNVCRNEPAEYRITVENTGSVTDTYSLNTNVESANVPDLELGPNESQTFRVTVREDVGDHAVVARATSQTLASISASQDASLNVENCYGLTLESQGEHTVRIDQENRTLMTFNLINSGTRENTYTLTFTGPEWMDVKPFNETLAPGESQRAFLYVAPDFFAENGTYTGTLTVRDQSGTVEQVVAVNATVGNQTVTTETEGQDRTGLTGQLISRASGLAAIIFVLAALFVGGYWYFQRRWDEDVLEPEDTGNGNGNGGPSREEVRDQVSGQDDRQQRRREQGRDEHGRFTSDEDQNGD